MSPLKALFVLAAASAFAVASVAPASAEPGPTVQALRALDQRGLLTGSEDVSAAGAVSARTGVTVGTGDAMVSLQPDTDSPGAIVADGSAVVYSEAGFHYAVTGAGARADAGYVVIDSAEAPNDFRFDVASAGKPARLEPTSDGGVLVKNPEGQTVNALAAAWAVDATGKQLPSWYTLDGGTVIQHVDHRGAAYPVVADPRLLCDGVFCTVMYNKAETQQLAASSGTAGVLITGGCTMLAGPIGGLSCGFAVAYVGQQAQNALNQGKCLGMRALIYVPTSTTHLVIEKC